MELETRENKKPRIRFRVRGRCGFWSSSARRSAPGGNQNQARQQTYEREYANVTANAETINADERVVGVVCHRCRAGPKGRGRRRRIGAGARRGGALERSRHSREVHSVDRTTAGGVLRQALFRDRPRDNRDRGEKDGHATG